MTRVLFVLALLLAPLPGLASPLFSTAGPGLGCSGCLYVATTGSDTTGTGTLAAPFATIAKALTVVNPPTTTMIMVENGTYTCPNGGAGAGDCANVTTAGVTIRAQNRRQAILEPPASSTSGMAIFVQPGADNVTIDGLVVDGCASGECPNGNTPGVAGSYWAFGTTHASSATLDTFVDAFGNAVNPQTMGCATGMSVGDADGDIPSASGSIPTISAISATAITLSAALGSGAGHADETIFCWGGARDGQWRTGFYSNAQYTIFRNNTCENLAVANPMFRTAAGGSGGSCLEIDGYDAATVGPTGTTASGSAVVSSLSAMTGIAAGGGVTGTGIPAGTVVTQVDGACGSNCVTLNQPATSSNTAEALTFYAAPPCAGAATLPCGTVEDNIVNQVGLMTPGVYEIHCVYASNYGAAYENNIISNCPAGWGIEMWHGASHLTIANNVIFQARGGIQVGSGQTVGSGEGYWNGGNSDTIVFNNIVYDCTVGGPMLGLGQPNQGNAWAEGIDETTAGDSTGTLPAPYNLYLDNTIGCSERWSLQATSGHTDAHGSPSFTNYLQNGTGVYSLLASSWGVDAGAVSAVIGGAGGRTANAPALAFDGTTRPQGAADDAGAYETSASGTLPEVWDAAFGNNDVDVVGTLATYSQLHSGSSLPVYGASCQTSGKYYWEIAFGSGSTGGNSLAIGIANLSAGTATGYLIGDTASDDNSLGYYPNGDVFLAGSALSTADDTWSAGSRVAVALDLTDGKVWFRVNSQNRWDGASGDNPATDTGGYALPAATTAHAVCPAADLYNAPDTVTGYFTAASWTGTAPSGFGPIDGPTPPPASVVYDTPFFPISGY